MTNQPEDPLLRDINHVLQYEVEFRGTFALSMVVPTCPNPGLDIDGVGRIALPLNEQTAELIVSAGEQAPCGLGMDTVMDITVRDTIQIDASNIHFRNPKWAPGIQELVENEVWDELGCAPFTTPPKCEPYKLLLYKPGAHFLPHQDTEKAPGMFATLVIILPSEFTGGEIHVSHGGENKVFDNAKDSAFDTTMLAWYTDVTHEVKEISSGYRLALSYHLINTSPGISPPHLPNGDTCVQSLRKIFGKWSRGEYPALKVNEAIAYYFLHEYSRTSLRGAMVKGNDHHVASILRDAAESEGILVVLGRLSAHIEGRTGDHGWQIYDGEGDSPEYGTDEHGRQDCPVMSYVFSTEMWVDEVQDLQGRETEITKIGLAAGSILPYRVFSGEWPNDAILSKGYYGNDGAGVDFMYKSAALVMFPKTKQLSIMLSMEGAKEWALKEYENSKSEGRTKENREIVRFLGQQKEGVSVAGMLKTAIGWKDAELWCDMVGANTRRFLEEPGYRSLCDGWEAFGLDGVRAAFEMLFRSGEDHEQKESIKFLLFVKEKLGADREEDEWISGQAAGAVESYNLRQEHPGLIDIVRWKGLGFASSVVLAAFTKRSYTMSLERIAEFGMKLIEYKEELIALPQVEGQTDNAQLFGDILDEILATAIPEVLRENQRFLKARVSTLLSICIRGNRSGRYKELLDCISRLDRVAFYDRYVDLYSEIIPELIKLHREHGISVSSSPLGEFLRYVVGMYVQDVLGTEEGSPYLKPSMFTCDHEGCSRANDFLRSEEKEQRIPLDRNVKRCVSSLRINNRYDVLKCSPDWDEKPPLMDLVKTPEALAALSWSVRLGNTRELLEAVGTEEEVCEIMGERCQDLKKALEGSQAFTVAEAGREEGDKEMEGIE